MLRKHKRDISLFHFSHFPKNDFYQRILGFLLPPRAGSFFYTHFLSVSIPDSFIILKIPKFFLHIFSLSTCDNLFKWEYVQERGHSMSQCCFLRGGQFNAHMFCGRWLGYRVCLDMERFKSSAIVAWQILSSVKLRWLEETYLKTKEMRETATTSMSSKLKPLRQKAFLCRMNPQAMIFRISSMVKMVVKKQSKQLRICNKKKN